MARKPLYGPDGREIDMSALRQDKGAPTLIGIRTPFADHPARGMTPFKLARLLLDAESTDPMRYLELAEDIEERDLHYSGVLGTRKRSVVQLDITVSAASDAAEDVADADLVREVIDNEAMQHSLFDCLDAIGKGYSLTEIIWDTSASQWMPQRLEYRDPRWFWLDRINLTTPLLKTDNGPQPLDPYKWIFHTHKAKSGLPVRSGLARVVSWIWLFKSMALKEWVGFAELYGQPLRVGKYGPGTSDTDRDILLQAVGSIGTDAAAIIPSNMVIEFQSAAGGSNGTVYRDLCAYLDQQVSKAVLGQTATTDAISGGHAVGKEHREVQEDIERSDAVQLATTLNRDLVRPLIDLNKGPRRRYPTIRIGRAETVDIPQMSQALSILVPLGLKVSATEVREKLGFDEPDPGDDLLRPAQGGGGVPLPKGGAGAGDGDPGEPMDNDAAMAALAASFGDATARRIVDAQRDLIDQAVDAILTDWEPAQIPVQQIVTAAKAATSFDELRAAIDQLASDMDVSGIQQLLSRLTFNARIAGRAGVGSGAPTDA